MSEQDSRDQQSLEDKILELKRRLIDDADFRARVEEDPIEVLSEAGMPEGTIGPFLREVGIEAEVSGYNFFPLGGSGGGIGYPTTYNEDPTDPNRGLPA